jgi:TRAP-type transport system periplasmic protein
MRKTIRFAAAVLALAVLFTSGMPVVATNTAILIKLAMVPPKDTSYHRLLLEMSEKWRNLSNGDVKVTVYAGGTQGSEADVVMRMSTGQLQAGMLSVGGLAEIDPSVAALQEIPMLFRSLDEEEYVLDKLRPDLEARLRDKGFVTLFWGDSGWVRFFSRKDAARPADFKTMKIFVTASGSAKQMQIMQALGYRPVPLDMADALIQLQTGGVDAVPTLPLLALANQYYTVTKHMLELPWVPLVGATVVTEKAWNSIPLPLREPMLKAARDAGRQIQQAGRQENAQAIDTMTKRSGLQVHQLTPELEAEWRQFAESIYPKIRGTMVPEATFDQARHLVAEYRAAHKSPQ